MTTELGGARRVSCFPAAVLAFVLGEQTADERSQREKLFASYFPQLPQ